MKKDEFIGEIRGGQTQAALPAKRFGVYNSKEMELYVQKLQERLSSVEKLYQERYEEMRTSLLGITRERDAQLERNKLLERQLSEAQDWETHLKEKDMVAVPQAAYERLQGIDAIDMEIVRLTQDNTLLNQEQTRLMKEIEVRDEERRKAAELADVFGQLQTQLQAREEKYQQLGALLEQQRQQGSQAQVRLEAAQLRIVEQDEESRQNRTQFQALSAQYQAAQDMIRQLVEDKKTLANESAQQMQRQTAQQASLIHRYQSLLDSQQKCLKQLQDSFTSSVQCLSSLAEPGLLGFAADTEHSGEQ